MMNAMTTPQQSLINSIVANFPDQTEFYPRTIYSLAETIGINRKDADRLIKSQPKVRRGIYNLEGLVLPFRNLNETKEMPKLSASVQSVLNDEVYVPKLESTYVKWGNYKDIEQIVSSNVFYPVYVAGLSGNGKTMMIEQACAKTNRQYVRVQITPETDEDDLIGGFRLLNGETVFSEGPVVKAMKQGAVLLIDEIDRGSNKIMCLQGVLEGKPILIKKTGQVVTPAKGFNVIATANTKGKGSEDGRFISATVIDEAFLERFTITMEQPYPSKNVEKKIIIKHMEKFDCLEPNFAETLSVWSETIRKTYEDGGIDELISTRRLCHIVQTYSIFKDRMKAIELCVNRFDADTKEAFLDLYTKVDASVTQCAPPPETNLDDILENALNG
jgi:hypothetical protein